MTFPKVRSLLETELLLTQGIAAQLYVGACVYVIHDGDAFECSLGVANPSAPVRQSSLFTWYCAGKPVAAIAMVQLAARGLLDIDDPVSRHVPEFDRNGKGAVTIRHILTHTTGLRHDPSLSISLSPWDEIIDHINAATLESTSPPGHVVRYHRSWGWYVLGEIVRRVDGREFSEYAKEEIFEPLGMQDSWFELPSDVYRSYGDRIAIIYNVDGIVPSAATFPDDEVVAGHCSPGMWARGTMSDLATLYGVLLHPGDSNNVLSTEAADLLRMPARRFYPTTKGWSQVALGLIVNQLAFGHFSSKRSFGHCGMSVTTAFADPDADVVVAFALNGLTQSNSIAEKRSAEVSDAIYHDLGVGVLEGSLGGSVSTPGVLQTSRYKGRLTEMIVPGPLPFLSDDWFARIRMFREVHHNWMPNFNYDRVGRIGMNVEVLKDGETLVRCHFLNAFGRLAVDLGHYKEIGITIRVSPETFRSTLFSLLRGEHDPIMRSFQGGKFEVVQFDTNDLVNLLHVQSASVEQLADIDIIESFTL